jgi:putative ABC transport system permease protein
MSSYLKFLSRNKLYTAIEAVGLAVSLAFVVIIFCYVAQHVAITRENPHRKEIYGVTIQNMLKYQNGMKETIGESIPEIQAITEFGWLYSTDLRADGQLLRLGQVLGCDRDFFDFFPVQFAEGQPDQIDEALTAFVSEEMAQVLSQSGEVVGRTIQMMKHDFTVVGVYTDIGTSLFYAMPDVIVNVNLTDGVTYYGGIDSPAVPANMFENVWLFIRTFPDVDQESLCDKLATATEALYLKILGREYPVEPSKIKLVRLDEVFYFDGETSLKKGDKVMMRSLLAVGLLLLISSMFNYINLNVALTSKRAKEMATRRLHGATKGRIIGKYLLESLAFTTVCMVLGILLAEALSPLVNRLLGGDVGVKILFTPFYLVSYLLIVVVVALLAGLIPAIVVSRAKPIDVVTGAFRFRNKMVLSKVFIVLQNVIAIVLIALVITMEVQMRHMERRPVGCRTDNLFYVESILTVDEAFENDLLALPCVKRLGHTYGYPGCAYVATKWMPLNDRENMDKWVRVRYLMCDTTAFEMFGFDIKAMYGQLDEDQWLLTQGLLEAQTGMPMEQFDIDSLGVWYKRNLRSDMCGVLGDFALDDAAHVVDETFGAVNIIGKVPKLKWVTYHPVLEIVGDHAEARKSIKELYDKHMSKKEVYWEPWVFDFIDNLQLKHLEATKNRMRLVDLFMAVAVLLSLLGLVAMSTHFASEREKTIAIRKVFGGTMQSEIRRNLRDYVIMILIANVIAIPIAVWVCGRYLEDFVYRIDLYPWIFVVTVVLSFAIAIGSVLWQIVSVAKVNPVWALKKE